LTQGRNSMLLVTERQETVVGRSFRNANQLEIRAAAIRLTSP